MDFRQLTIFDALARRSDPETSQEAAGRTDGARLAQMVYEELKSRGGSTSHELAARMGLSLVTVSPRMKPLEDAGKVRRIGRRDGRTIWEAT